VGTHDAIADRRVERRRWRGDGDLHDRRIVIPQHTGVVLAGVQGCHVSRRARPREAR